jgi:hypothetical protein
MERRRYKTKTDKAWRKRIRGSFERRCWLITDNDVNLRY